MDRLVRDLPALLSLTAMLLVARAAEDAWAGWRSETPTREQIYQAIRLVSKDHACNGVSGRVDFSARLAVKDHAGVDPAGKLVIIQRVEKSGDSRGFKVVYEDSIGQL